MKEANDKGPDAEAAVTVPPLPPSSPPVPPSPPVLPLDMATIRGRVTTALPLVFSALSLLVSALSYEISSVAMDLANTPKIAIEDMTLNRSGNLTFFNYTIRNVGQVAIDGLWVDQGVNLDWALNEEVDQGLMITLQPGDKVKRHWGLNRSANLIKANVYDDWVSGRDAGSVIIHILGRVKKTNISVCQLYAFDPSSQEFERKVDCDKVPWRGENILLPYVKR